LILQNAQLKQTSLSMVVGRPLAAPQYSLALTCTKINAVGLLTELFP